MPQKPKLLSTLMLCLVVLVISSCHNNGSSDGGSPVNNSYLASARIVSQGTIITDSFSYDSQHRVARFAEYETNGTDSADVTVDFNFSGGNALPVSYTATSNGGSPDTHELTFDGQGRITKDTSTSGSHFVTNYFYSGNYVICNILFDGTFNDAQIDTLVITSGNITGEKVWGFDNGTPELQGNLTYGHAAAANPGYKAEVANAVGPLLYVLSVYNFGGYADYISKAVMNKVSGYADGLPSAGYGYNVSTDDKGRVSSIAPTGAGVPAGVKVIFTYY